MQTDHTKLAEITNAARAAVAIDQMGGAMSAAKKISELTGKDVTRERVQKWKLNGIAPPWHPVIHQLTGIPLHDLDPEIYPAYIFK